MKYATFFPIAKLFSVSNENNWNGSSVSLNFYKGSELSNILNFKVSGLDLTKPILCLKPTIISST